MLLRLVLLLLLLVLALPLLWFSQVIDWAAWRVTPWARVAALAVALLIAAITYGVALWAFKAVVALSTVDVNKPKFANTDTCTSAVKVFYILFF
jgi:hypothetical protein